MTYPAISVESLCKRYRIAHGTPAYRTFRETLTDLFNAPMKLFRAPANDSKSEEFWALKNVSFEVTHGEAIGVIGRNGAGKSTLLKLLTRITKPTSGRIRLVGRAASLLEVGTGFHPELTGRENIYLNGAILGMSRHEIASKFDEIVAFAEISQFLDTPVKRYSSGMYVRLAFAVAAHLEPEILLLDEVLAVGDVAFQRKCLGKMGGVVRDGRTVVFVSHNLVAVENLCQKALVLDRGRLVFSGPAKQAIDCYLQIVEGDGELRSSHIIDLRHSPRSSRFPRALLQRLELFTKGGKPVNGTLKVGDPLEAHIHFRLDEPTATVDATFAFDNLLGQRIFHGHSIYEPGRSQGEWSGDHVFVCKLPSLPLVPGQYKIKVALDVNHSPVDGIEDAVRLTINETDYYGSGKFPTSGLIVLDQHWDLR
jgi:lipopolysaccharide transport system ATP-binding protein